MKKLVLSFVLIALASSIIAQREVFKPEILEVKKCDLPPLSIEFELIPESLEYNYWELTWEDPFPNDRPEEFQGSELFCLVRDTSGIIGYYEGLSTPMTYCSLYPKSEEVTIEFYVMNYEKEEFNQCRYKPINVPLERFLKHNITLENNPEIVSAECKTGVALERELPAEWKFIKYFDLNAHYINLDRMKMMIGEKWVDRFDSCILIDDLNLARLDPDYYYDLIDGSKVRGSEIINKPKKYLRRLNPAGMALKGDYFSMSQKLFRPF